MSKGAPPPSETLFVTGLPMDIDNSFAQEVFSQYGSVKQVTVLPVAAGKNAAAAFVIMHTVDDAKWIVENVNGNVPQNLTNPVTVVFATPRDSRGGKGGPMKGMMNAMNMMMNSWGGWGEWGGKDKGGKGSWGGGGGWEMGKGGGKAPAGGMNGKGGMGGMSGMNGKGGMGGMAMGGTGGMGKGQFGGKGPMSGKGSWEQLPTTLGNYFDLFSYVREVKRKLSFRLLACSVDACVPQFG
eukprot:Skav214334  [mRNA]  locus=scaffold86:346406:348484:+ [translate_table: standard]